MRLEGKVAVVTGSTRAIAEAYAQEGAMNGHVAKACIFLASDDAGFTGETLVSDGGWLAYGFT